MSSNDNSDNLSGRLWTGQMNAHAIRLEPGEDLVGSLLLAASEAMKTSFSSSSFVMTAVGSLEEVSLRMANASRADGDGQTSDIRTWKERLEVVSLVGTFSADGGKHLHMTISDSDGRVFGGHVISGRVYTTLELVLGTIDGIRFSRSMDARTKYRELSIDSIQSLKRKTSS